MNDMKRLIGRTADSHNQHQSYRLSFFEDVNVKGRVWGRITYLFNGKETGIMSQSDTRTIRAYWHRQCRLNRARNAGRDYRHIICPTDARERRVLGHKPVTSKGDSITA